MPNTVTTSTPSTSGGVTPAPSTSWDSRSLVLFHHDPYHTDDELDALLADARGRWGGAHEQVCLAHEGMTITLDRDGVRFAD